MDAMAEPRAFRFEQFQDYLTFERGLSDRTVSAYARDLARWAGFMVTRGVVEPGAVTPIDLRDWVFGLKDAGLAATLDPPRAVRRAHVLRLPSRRGGRPGRIPPSAWNRPGWAGASRTS